MRLSRSSLAILLLSTASCALGCGSGHDEAAKQIHALESEIERLKASDAALADRLERAEIELRGQRKAFEKAEVSPGAGRGGEARQAGGDKPELSVVRLSPDADPDDPDADTPRLVLRASGSSGVIQERPAGKSFIDEPRESSDFTKKKPPSFGAAKKLGKPASEKKNP